MTQPHLQPRSLDSKSSIASVRPPSLHGKGPRMVKYVKHGGKLMDLGIDVETGMEMSIRI